MAGADSVWMWKAETAKIRAKTRVSALYIIWFIFACWYIILYILYNNINTPTHRIINTFDQLFITKIYSKFKLYFDNFNDNFHKKYNLNL